MPPSATQAPEAAPALPADAYRLLVEGLRHAALCWIDPHGCVVLWTAAAAQMVGHPAAWAVGRSFETVCPPEDAPTDWGQTALATARTRGAYEEEGYRLRADGTRFWAHLSIAAVSTQAPCDEPRGFAVELRTPPKRPAPDEAARQAEQRFHRLVDSVTDYAVFLLDPAGNVETWNEGAHRAKGYDEQEIVGRHFSAFYTDEDRAMGKPEAILETVRREGRFEDEGWRVRKDGSRFWANVIITALRDETGEVVGFAKVTRDLTARREAEQVQRSLLAEQTARAVAEQVAARAQEANRIKDEFLATVSHELRTPLNAIVGWASLLRKEPLEGTLAHGIEVIDRNARAQVHIVDDILDVSRIITGKLRLDPRETDIVAIVRNAIEVVRPAAAAKRIALSFEPEDERAPLWGDPERLQQVVWNLLSNAVKFTPRGGSVAVTAFRTADELTVSVTDTGRGMESAFLERAFDRFRQEEATVSRRVGGLGLGLAIVRHIVELHGGAVAAESPGVDLGSTFRFTLPLSAAEPSSPALSPAALAPTPATTDGLGKRDLVGVRVLLVEDEEDTRELLAIVLRHAGASVEEAGTAQEAFASVLACAPQIVLSDIGLPGEDGYSLLRRIRALGPSQGGDVPALALSAYTRPADKAAAESAGFDRHIGKPLALDAVMAAIRELLAGRT